MVIIGHRLGLLASLESLLPQFFYPGTSNTGAMLITFTRDATVQAAGVIAIFNANNFYNSFRLSHALVVHRLAMHRHFGWERAMLIGAPSIQAARVVRPVAAATADTRD
jgi:hypothetical protein